jgi:hypothetical protein
VTRRSSRTPISIGHVAHPSSRKDGKRAKKAGQRYEKNRGKTEAKSEGKSEVEDKQKEVSVAKEMNVLLQPTLASEANTPTARVGTGYLEAMIDRIYIRRYPEIDEAADTHERHEDRRTRSRERRRARGTRGK